MSRSMVFVAHDPRDPVWLRVRIVRSILRAGRVEIPGGRYASAPLAARIAVADRVCIDRACRSAPHHAAAFAVREARVMRREDARRRRRRMR